MKRPELSIFVATYNAASLLDETCSSILDQVGVSLERIVVDDGSTDESAAVLALRLWCDERYRILTQPNRGLAAALVAGCKAARGAYIAWQDASDSSLPGRLAKQAARLESQPDAVMCSSLAEFRGPQDELLYTAAAAYRPQFVLTYQLKCLQQRSVQNILLGDLHYG